MAIPSLILGAGAAGVGKSTVLRDIVQSWPDMFYLDRDVVLEPYLHTNPFSSCSSDGKMIPDERVSFDSDHYRNWLRSQIYASMFGVALQNVSLGKSCLLDANYVAWLRDPEGPWSLARRFAALARLVDPEEIRLAIVFFYVVDPLVVRDRLVARMAQDSEAFDRDGGKVFDNFGSRRSELVAAGAQQWPNLISQRAWQEHLSREPVTTFDTLSLYADILLVDRTPEYTGNYREDALRQIRTFLALPRTLAQTGIFHDEPFAVTLKRLSPPNVPASRMRVSL